MKRSFSIIIIFIALATLGCALIPKLPVKLVPSRILPGLSVSFSMPHTSPRVVESEVTSRLESMLARINGVKEVKSVSSSGGGWIDLGFDKHTDMQTARFEASALVRQAWPDLPEGVSYPQVSSVRTIDRASRPMLTYTVNASRPASEIMAFAEEVLRPVIGRLDGVERIQLNGATPMEWHLTYDTDRLRTLGLDPKDIVGAISEHNSSEFLGMGLTDGGEWLAVRTSASGDVARENMGSIPVMLPDSTYIQLDRLVTFDRVESEPSGYSRINGLNSIYCDIYSEEGANQLDVAKRVRMAIEEIRLPEDCSVTLVNDMTEYISSELEKIYFRTGLTLIILLVFVALVTLNLRYMAVITISLLLSLAVSVIFYYLLGIEIQLYSLAGITISLNLIIDNIIVMSDHYLRRRDLKVFTAVLAATLTTVGALGIVFFLDEDLRLNLQDFVAVVIVNLMVSLGTALWLVPALIQRIGAGHSARRPGRRKTRAILWLNRGYAWFIRFSLRWRWAFVVLAVLGFGLPVFMIPEKVEGWDRYNAVFDSRTYKEEIRPWVNTLLGGTLRLFVEKVYEGSYFNRDDMEPTVEINASLPNGSTLEQMNDLIKKMEAYLAGFGGIKQFRSDIYSARRASISVSFTKEAIRTGFPYRLKSQVISKALTLGGGSWAIYGLEDTPFNNSVTDRPGSYRVKMTGYNYDELEALAERFRQKLLGHQRVKEVNINSEFTYYKDDYTEFYLDIDKEALGHKDLTVGELYDAITPAFGKDIRCGRVSGSNDEILLSSRQSRSYDVWALMNVPFTIKDKTFKLSDFASVSRRNAPPSVAKENQQYRLCLQYDYIGSYDMGDKMLARYLKEFRQEMPLGYSISNEKAYLRWGDTSAANYWLLLLVVTIIFFTASILFDSLTLPLVIILTIPISFIGVFLVFYLTRMNFDQGGFASFVLLCGITVNAAIYLIYEYKRRSLKGVKGYVRAFNVKIVPILLTVLSTILGFIPFMVGTDGREGFWFPLALGTIGGLAMSLLGLVIFLPLLTLWRCKERRFPTAGRK